MLHKRLYRSQMFPESNRGADESTEAMQETVDGEALKRARKKLTSWPIQRLSRRNEKTGRNYVLLG